MSDLTTLANSLRRAVATPGTFARTYPNTTDADLIGALADGVAEAQLDGFFMGNRSKTLNITDGTVIPDLTPPEGALVVIYAAANFVQAQLLNFKNRQHYAARGTEYEVEQSASILTALLKQFNERKAALLAKAQAAGAGAAFLMADGYFLAATGSYAVTGDGWTGVGVGPGDYYDPYGQG